MVELLSIQIVACGVNPSFGMDFAVAVLHAVTDLLLVNIRFDVRHSSHEEPPCFFVSELGIFFLPDSPKSPIKSIVFDDSAGDRVSVLRKSQQRVNKMNHFHFGKVTPSFFGGSGGKVMPRREWNGGKKR